MKRILLTIVFPYWYLLAKTMIGGIILIPLAPAIPAILAFLVFPELGGMKGEKAESMAVGLVIFSLLCSPFVVFAFMDINQFLKNYYKEIGLI